MYCSEDRNAWLFLAEDRLVHEVKLAESFGFRSLHEIIGQTLKIYLERTDYNTLRS